MDFLYKMMNQTILKKTNIIGNVSRVKSKKIEIQVNKKIFSPRFIYLSFIKGKYRLSKKEEGRGE